MPDLHLLGGDEPERSLAAHFAERTSTARDTRFYEIKRVRRKSTAAP